MNNKKFSIVLAALTVLLAILSLAALKQSGASGISSAQSEMLQIHGEFGLMCVGALIFSVAIAIPVNALINRRVRG